ncbi:MAG: DUF1926 domain-containing protein [Nitrospirae bacterium]|nr:DUF1926 domain-containing protein [Nitrospirota bacterium]
MKKVNFAMALHFHQPVDNFDHVFMEAYEKSYKPFIDVLEKFPKIRLTLHYSGSLLEWIEANKPDLIKRIAGLVARGQVEMMTGGFYEPILCVIPRRDSIGQISMLTEYIKDKFNTESKGMWLTERIWEPHLPSILHDSGIKYLIVDDTHFRYAGLLENQLYGYYSTEDEGKVVYLFPSNERLRYSIPFREPHETIDYLRSVATEKGDNVLVYGDDGEKFGLWPETYDWVYNRRWLERFFEALTHEASQSSIEPSWLNITTLGDVQKNVKAHGRVYIPTASYREMMEWSLPTESGNLFEDVLNDVKWSGKEAAYVPFLRGGFWRNFLEKYPESNNMHKKMFRVSNKVAQMNSSNNDSFDPAYIGKSVAKKGIGLPQNIYESHLELWRGQVNCPYWHGIFGGLYLGHLRNAVYNHLIKAEKIADETGHNEKTWIDIEVTDFDCDGSDEIVVTTEDISFVVDVHKGGMLTELDYRPASCNLLNTLARRPEVYHKKIVENVGKHEGEAGGPQSIHDIVKSKEADLHLYLQYDSYRKGMLIDHVFANDTSLDTVIQNRHEEVGGFPFIPYIFTIRDTEKGKGILLEGEGLVNGNRIQISKEIIVSKDNPDLKFNYSVKNISGDTINIRFGTELNFAMLDGNSEMCKYVIEGVSPEDSGQRSKGESKDIKSFKINNRLIATEIGLAFSEKCTLWRYPVETISQSESGFEREYQSSVVVPNWNIVLNQGGEWKVGVTLTFRRI